MEKHISKTVGSGLQEQKIAAAVTLSPPNSWSQVQVPYSSRPRTHKNRYAPGVYSRSSGVSIQSRRLIAYDSDDEEEPEPKIVPAQAVAKPTFSNQHKKVLNGSKPNQGLPQIQLGFATKLSPETIVSIKKVNLTLRSPPHVSTLPEPTNIIDSDWPFAHFGKLQGQLGRSTRKNKARKARKYTLPSRRMNLGLSPFLYKLPGEIRTRIYEFVVPQTRILICVNKPEKEQLDLQKAWENEYKYVKMPRSRLYCMIDRGQIKAGFEVSAGLLFTCKQVRSEVELLMYSRTIFCFQSPKTVDMFLNTASKEGIKVIESIELRHEGYGEPKLTEHVMLKQNHDRKWTDTYQRINREVVSLKSLRLEMRITDWPVQLQAGEGWHRRLMPLIQDKLLESVRAYLKHPRFEEPKMRVVARRLENRMMSSAGRLARDKQETMAVLREVQAKREADRKYRATLPPVQATKVLKIRVEHSKITPKTPVKTARVYTQSVASWEWQYGKGNTLGRSHTTASTS